MSSKDQMEWNLPHYHQEKQQNTAPQQGAQTIVMAVVLQLTLLKRQV